MTLEEALNIIGICITAVCTETEGHEITSHLLFNCVLEEWLAGDFNNINADILNKYKDKYGGNMLKQAARVIANNISIYGNVDDG